MTDTHLPPPDRRHKALDLRGRVFDRLTVTGYAFYRARSNYWHCVCVCGVTCVRCQRALFDPHKSSCGCVIDERMAARPGGGYGSRNALLASYKRGAAERGYTFELSIEEFEQLTHGDCFYCGAPPLQIIRNGKCRPYTYNGIDRVDNARGYTTDNVRSCCGQCNTAKNTLTETEFFAWVGRVARRAS